MFKLAVFVPEAHVEAVKAAMFNAGGGRIGDYDHCSWQVLGAGQFRPLEGSQPFIGNIQQVETVLEYKVEMVCSDDVVRDVIAALHDAHPYEEPAFDVIALVDPASL